MNAYQQSQVHIVEANRLLQTEELPAARAAFIRAADLQWSFVNGLPDDRIRTASVYGLSAAILYYKGNDLEAAERLAHMLLSKPHLEGRSRVELRELLARIWNERQMEQMGYRMSSSPLSVVFRYGVILHGLAPTDAVDTPIRSVLNMFQRIAAWKSHLPAERKPSSVMNERYRAFSSEPVLSSYRIDLYLAEDEQLRLDMPDDAGPMPSPDEVMSSFTELIRYASVGDYEGICDLVPEEQYRKTFVMLLRNVVPDGTQVGEIEFRRPSEPKESAVILSSRSKAPLTQMLKREKLVGSSSHITDDSGTSELLGILRAVDLDENRLRLDQGGDKEEFNKADDILDDVIGPMLNKRVRITGGYQTRKRRKIFVATDIELAPEPD